MARYRVDVTRSYYVIGAEDAYEAADVVADGKVRQYGSTDYAVTDAATGEPV
jgi:Tfp pilus assembly ATPase PilU